MVAETRIKNGVALRRGFGLIVILMGVMGAWNRWDKFALLVVAVPSRRDPEQGQQNQPQTQRTKATARPSPSGTAKSIAMMEQEHTPLSFHYQDRLNRIQWLKGQCEFCQSIIQPNQTLFPYLEVPPLAEERAEQYDVPLKARIAVLHVWSSDESLAPPFFQYWLASAMANAPIADFFIFVPDTSTAGILQRLMPSPVHNDTMNIKLHVVGDLIHFYHSRLGSTLDAANFEFSGKTISRLKPMLGYVFEDYIESYSHWAWADMDMILGNLTKFLVRPLAEGYDVISMSSVDYYPNSQRWSSHMCSRFKVALAGQLVVFINTNETRNYFRRGDLHGLEHRYDEGPFPALLQKIGIRTAHVFAQVTDQFGFLNGTQLDWSPQHGLRKLGSGGAACYGYEAALVHVLKGKRLVRPTKKASPRVIHFVSGTQTNSVLVPTSSIKKGYDGYNASLENIIFPGPWEQWMSGFTLKFPVSEAHPWQTYTAPSAAVLGECTP